MIITLPLPKDRMSIGLKSIVFELDNKLYRALNQEVANELVPIIKNNQDLFDDKRVVGSKLTSLTASGYPYILEHTKIEFINFIQEWTSSMIKDAALFDIDINLELLSRNLCLWDGHPYNIVYKYAAPIFVDIHSIMNYTGSFCFTNDFAVWFIDSLPNKAANKAKFIAAKDAMGRNISKDMFINFLKTQRKFVETILPSTATTPWTGYTQPDSVNLNDKQKSVMSVLDKVDKTSVLDLGSNQGWYTKMASDKGFNVVSVEIDETCVDNIYQYARDSKRNILPIRADCMKPPKQTKPPYDDFDIRYRCDVTMSLALLHHLVFKQFYNFDQIVTKLNNLTKKTAIVEFIPPDDVFVKNWMTPAHTSWYSQDNFIKMMLKYFSSVEILKSTPPPRSILVFTR